MFWALQVAGWLGYAFVQYIGSLMQEMRGIFVLIIILGAYAGFLLTVPLRYIYQRIWNSNPVFLVLVVLGCSYIAAAAWAVIDNATHWEIYKFGYRPQNWLFYFQHTIAKLYIVLCWSGLYFVIKYYQLLQDEKQKALTATSMAHQSQLKMLRYQLNPHFLFNTLNAISTLVLVNENKTANQMVSKLSEFLRFSLDNEPIKRISLAKEIDALMLYLDIEKVRFADRLQVKVDVSDDARIALVPSLILQPLIENSIKYAVAKLETTGVIESRCEGRAGEFTDSHLRQWSRSVFAFESRAANTGCWFEKHRRTACEPCTESNTHLLLRANEPSGCVVSIQIPWQPKESA